MLYAIISEVKERVSFSEISSLPDNEIQNYIDRATHWIHRETKRNFQDEQDLDALSDLKTATILLVEYLWLNDHPEYKEAVVSGVESEKIGFYSYSSKNQSAEGKTGIVELDSIIDSLKMKELDSFSFFSISGPSRG